MMFTGEEWDAIFRDDSPWTKLRAETIRKMANEPRNCWTQRELIYQKQLLSLLDKVEGLLP